MFTFELIQKYEKWALEDNIPGEDLARVGIFAWNNPNIYHTQAGRGGTEPNSGINIISFVPKQSLFSDSLYQLPKVRLSAEFSAGLLPKSENYEKYWLWNRSRLISQNWRGRTWGRRCVHRSPGEGSDHTWYFGTPSLRPVKVNQKRGKFAKI